MKYIENLSAAYESNSTIFDYRARYLYENTSVFFVPMVNPDGVDLVVGNMQKYYPDIYNYAKTLSENYPNIEFPNGWKANINRYRLKLTISSIMGNSKRNKIFSRIY